MEKTWTTTIRVTASHRNVGVLLTLFAVGMLVFSTYVALFNVDGSFTNPLLAAFLFFLFWSFFALLGIWLYAQHYFYRLYIGTDEILQVTALTRKHLRFPEVRELKWGRLGIGGSAKLSDLFETLRIDLSSFTHSDRVEVVKALRAAIGETKQVGWSKYDERFSQLSQKKKATSRLSRFLLALFFLANGIVFFIIWTFKNDIQFLIVAPANIIFGIHMLLQFKRNRTAKQQYPLCAKSLIRLKNRQGKAINE